MEGDDDILESAVHRQGPVLACLELLQERVEVAHERAVGHLFIKELLLFRYLGVALLGDAAALGRFS